MAVGRGWRVPDLSNTSIQITVLGATLVDGTVLAAGSTIPVRLWLANGGSTLAVTQVIPGLQVGVPSTWIMLSGLPPEGALPGNRRITDALQDPAVTYNPAAGAYFLLNLYVQAGDWKDVWGWGAFVPSGTTGSLQSLTVRVQLALQPDPGSSDPTAGPWTETVAGSAVLLLLRGFGYGQTERDWFGAVQSMVVRAQQYVALAQQAAQSANPPGCASLLLHGILGLFGISPPPQGVTGPQLFPVFTFNARGGQGSVPQLKSTSQALGLLGLNTGLPQFWDRIPTDVLDAIQTAAGLTRRAWGQAGFAPWIEYGDAIGYLSPFDFVLKSLDGGELPTALTAHPPWGTRTWVPQWDWPSRGAWATSIMGQTHSGTGSTPDRLAIIQLLDEFAWSYVSPGPAFPTPVATEAVRHFTALGTALRQPQPWLNTFDPNDPGSNTFPEDPTSPVLGWRGFLQAATGFDGQPLPSTLFATAMNQADLSDLPDPTNPNSGDLTGWSLDQRVRYLWTMRFFARAGALGVRRAIWALQQQGLPTSALAYGHLRNQGGCLLDPWQTGAPSRQWPDWFEIGRQAGFTLWLEPVLETQPPGDDLSDRASQWWSYSANLAHSAANCAKAAGAPPDVAFGGMLTWFGQHPAGASYKVFSMVGHGAKGVDLYWCGPNFIGSGIGTSWIDDGSLDAPSTSKALAQVYQSVADAMQLLGTSESVLFPGVRGRGKIALLQPLCSWYWDDRQGTRLYLAELEGLQFALAHSQYTVDFIDAQGIADGHLDDYGYNVLYVTEPNIPTAVLNKIADWLQAGQNRVLVVTPGAGSLDEYNRPAVNTTQRFEQLLGLDPSIDPTTKSGRRDPGYPRWLDTDGTATTAVTFTSSFQRDAGLPVTLRTRGPVQPLVLSGAESIATDAQNRCVAARMSVKDTTGLIVGHAVTLGFFPGWTYWSTAVWGVNPAALPQGWGDPERIVARMGATLAGATAAPRTAVATSGLTELNGVEVCRLDSDRGIGLVLLNWTDMPIAALTLTVPQVGAFIKATSAGGARVTATRNPDGSLTVTLPLQHVDVVLLRGPSGRPHAGPPLPST